MLTLLDYANLANDAYSAAPTIGVESSSARAVISELPSGRAIGFPGTNNGACVATDIDTLIYHDQGLGGVHQGTYEDLNSMWPQIAAESKIDIVYGHSLGGMLALMCAARLCLAGVAPKEVYSFEPAKISIDGTIRALFAQHQVKVTIVRNGHDLIPMLPEIPFEDWQHPGDVLQIGVPKLILPNIEDHLMNNVISSVKEYLQSQGAV